MFEVTFAVEGLIYRQSRRNGLFVKECIAIFAVGALSLCSAAEPKAVLNSNGSVTYKKLPPDVERLADVLSEGEFYGRIRLNTFFDNYREDTSARRDNWAAAFGGSVTYKSASYEGFSAAAGIYTSQNPFHMDDKDAVYLKSGKDATDRYAVLRSGEWGVTVPALAYMEYKAGRVEARAGRLIFNSVLTAANDSKMIPNTFEGYSLKSTFPGSAVLKAAWLLRQKLRGHTSFHHLLAYGDDPADPYSRYRENDDSAMHRGLTLTKLAAKGIKDRLFVLQYDGSFTNSLKSVLNYTTVPDLLSYASADLYYNFCAGEVSIAPGVRYLRQFDDGAGAIGGANLKTDTTGYRDPDSLKATLYAARLDVEGRVWRLRFGYSKTADEGDIVAPWRGFPTGGFTRVMGQYNWYANTKSYMVRADCDFGKAGLVPGLSGTIKYVIQDFDDTKPGVQADTGVLNFDAVEKFPALPALQARIRVAVARGDAQIAPIAKDDPSYTEYRFEMNYLF